MIKKVLEKKYFIITGLLLGTMVVLYQNCGKQEYARSMASTITVGNYWGEWSECSVTCGGGIQERKFICNVLPCPGMPDESRECNMQSCSAGNQGDHYDIHMAQNGDQDQRDPNTTQTLGGSTSDQGGADAANNEENSTEIISSLDQAPVFPSLEPTPSIVPAHIDHPGSLDTANGFWGSWSEWGSCSRPCDHGVQTRVRECLPGRTCEGESSQQQSCNDRACIQPLLPQVNINKVVFGKEHACALTATQALCWGKNSHGQLGQGHNNNVKGKVVIKYFRSDVHPPIDIVAGDYHTCLLTNGLALYCWGKNDKGQIGIGSNNDAFSPQQVLLVRGNLQPNTSRISAAFDNTCITENYIQNSTINSVLQCWGDNSGKQVIPGNRPFTSYNVPAMIFSDSESTLNASAMELVYNVAIGEKHICYNTKGFYKTSPNANISNIKVNTTCLGSSTHSQLSLNSMHLANPATTSFNAFNSKMVATKNATCTLYFQGTQRQLECAGKLDENAIPWLSTNVDISSIHSAQDPVDDIVAGRSHICLKTESGKVTCMGDNLHGAVGYFSPTYLDFYAKFTAAQTHADFFANSVIKDIFTSGDMTCVKQESRLGPVKCYGDGVWSW